MATLHQSGPVTESIVYPKTWATDLGQDATPTAGSKATLTRGVDASEGTESGGDTVNNCNKDSNNNNTNTSSGDTTCTFFMPQPLSNGDKLALGLGLGIGVPSVILAILTLCA